MKTNNILQNKRNNYYISYSLNGIPFGVMIVSGSSKLDIKLRYNDFLENDHILVYKLSHKQVREHPILKNKFYTTDDLIKIDTERINRGQKPFFGVVRTNENKFNEIEDFLNHNKID